MPLPKIIRKKGPFKSRYGITLENLKPYQKQILFNNPLCKEHFENDDQFTLIIFKLADMEINRKNDRKVYYNPYIDSISNDYDDVIESSKILDWKCAICYEDIKSKISEFNIDNFLCSKCRESHGKHTRIVDSRIVESSIDFKNHCRKILFKEQNTYLSYIRKFEKRS